MEEASTECPLYPVRPRPLPQRCPVTPDFKDLEQDIDHLDGEAIPTHYEITTTQNSTLNDLKNDYV